MGRARGPGGSFRPCLPCFLPAELRIKEMNQREANNTRKIVTIVEDDNNIMKAFVCNIVGVFLLVYAYHLV